MMWSAPSERTSSMLRAVPHTPVTSAPSALAIWTAMVPTPPEAPLIRTRVPALTCATSRMATRAVSPHITDAAASVNASPAGCLDHARDVAAADRAPGPAQPDARAHDVRRPGDGGPVRGVDAGGPHPDQDVAGADRGYLGLPELQHALRGSVA